MNKRGHKSKTMPRFLLSLFILIVILSLAGLLFVLALVAPAIWNVQLAASFPVIFGTFLVVHFVNAFEEFFFHRYVLHAPLIPFLAHFYKQHTLHHALTRVVTKKVAGVGAQEGLRIENKYSIVEETQHRASFFPWYALLAFGIYSTPFFILAQWLLPSAPIFLAGFAAVAWSLFLYEVFHALEHLPFEKWRPFLEHPRWGQWWKMFYAFHLRHHADIRSNEAISGFFGLPIADFVFGTWINPIALYEDGRIVEANEFKSPTPRFIGWLDKLADEKIRSRRKRESNTA